MRVSQPEMKATELYNTVMAVFFSFRYFPDLEILATELFIE